METFEYVDRRSFAYNDVRCPICVFPEASVIIGGRTDRFVIEVTTCDCGREADEVRVAMIN